MFVAVWQALRVDRGANEAAQGMVLYAILALVAGALIWLNPAALIVAFEGPVWLFAGPMMAIFLLSLVSIQLRDHLDAYRRVVAVPASAGIAVVGAYWFIERVFL